MMSIHLRVSASILLSFLVAVPASAAARRTNAQLDFFEKKIRPLLMNDRYNCHSANTNSKGGLAVDDRNGLTTGGTAGRRSCRGIPKKVC